MKKQIVKHSVLGTVRLEYALWRGCPATQWRGIIAADYMPIVVIRCATAKELYTALNRKVRTLALQKTDIDTYNKALRFQNKQ